MFYISSTFQEIYHRTAKTAKVQLWKAESDHGQESLFWPPNSSLCKPLSCRRQKAAFNTSFPIGHAYQPQKCRIHSLLDPWVTQITLFCLMIRHMQDIWNCNFPKDFNFFFLIFLYFHILNYRRICLCELQQRKFKKNHMCRSSRDLEIVFLENLQVHLMTPK